MSTKSSSTLKNVCMPSKWPGANARLLGLGVGLPLNPLDRLAIFSADDFERFVLEWADGVRRHIICPRFWPGLRETLLIVLVDIKRRLCGIASVGVR